MPVAAASFAPMMPAAAPADGAGLASMAASFAPATIASAPADLASVAHIVAASSEVASTADSIGSGGATAAQLQQALDESGLHVNGAGITVGVISNSFNELGGAPQDEADGALPPASQVQVIVPDTVAGGTDEGRAMMQVVHDVAPGANLDFASGEGGQQAIANSILALAAAGCKVICDDIYDYNEPMFQLGVISQAIQTVESEGVIYVTAAGNNGSLATGFGAYQANWAPASGSFDGYNLTNAQNFGGSIIQNLTVGGGSNQSVTLSLDWAQALGAATSDLEVLVFSNGQLVTTATNSSSGNAGNPIVTVNLAADASYQIAVVNLSGISPGAFKEIIVGDGITTSLSGANVGPLFGHAMTPGAITVGAVSSTDTPAFGVNPAINENFSSSGYDDQLLFNENGTPLASPDVISPVQISGVDNIATTVTDDGLNDFQGTSCATPTVAACVALMLEVNPKLTLAQVDEILQATANPMANSYVSGAGLIQIDPAVALAAPPTATSVAASTANSVTTVDAGQVVTINVAMTVPVTVTGTPILQLSDNEVAVYTSGSGSDTLSFTYAVLPGDNAANLQVTGLTLPSGDSIQSIVLNLTGSVTGSLGLTVNTTTVSPTTVQQEILGLYSALYNRATDFNGVGYWANVVGQQPDGSGVNGLDAGTVAVTVNDATVLGQLFVNTQATYFNATYGSLSDTAFITDLYANIGGNTTNISAGVTYWVNLLQAAEASGQSVQNARAGLVGQIVQDMIDYNVNIVAPGYTAAQWQAVVQRQDTIDNKIAVSEALSNASEQPGGSILVVHTIGDAAFNASTAILQSITYNPATVTAAITGINAAVAAQNLLLI